MADEQPKQVVVERERRSHTGIIVTVVAVVILILFAMYVLPAIMGGGTTNVNVTPTAQ